MAMDEAKSPQQSEDWSVILQSFPSKKKKDLAKRLSEIFDLDRSDAEQAISNLPLILLDGLSFTAATRIKGFFQKLGTVTEISNHEVIKKNCYQILWPQKPDLSYFLKDGTKPASGKAAPVPSVPVEGETPRSFSPEISQEEPKVPSKTSQEASGISPVPPVAEDADWKKRAKDLSEKLEKIQEAPPQVFEAPASAPEPSVHEVPAQDDEGLREEMRRREAQKKEESDEWRFKATALGDRVYELEDALARKTEELAQLSAELEKIRESAARAEELERLLTQKESESNAKQSEVQRWMDKAQTFENEIVEKSKAMELLSRELSSIQEREREALKKIDAFERNSAVVAEELRVKEEALRARDNALVALEKRVGELAAKAQECDALRLEYTRLTQERKAYEAKLLDFETRCGKIEEEHRRYRSRMERKITAATRELGTWGRSLDTLRLGFQKLTVFLGNESAVMDTGAKPAVRGPVGRPSVSPEKKNP
ncbi:MAG TPA: hypothetical protein PKI45_03490 [Candidatus Omnitrophota bacterium]|nr:hypothetical protein [Candidatus Omnitrophota bacterium]